MSRHHLVFVTLLALVSLCAGCSNTVAPNPVAAPTSRVVSPSAGTAQVQFAIRVADGEGTNAGPVPSIRALASAPPQVTFTLVTLNIGNVEQPIGSQSQTVTATNGSASATFTNVPTMPTLARVTVAGGNVGNFSDFHGAADLVAGVNTIVVNPKNSRLKQDVIANVIENIIANRQMFRFAPTDLVNRIRSIVTNLDRQAATVYQTAFSQTALQLDPANLNTNLVAMPGTKAIAESLSSPTTQIRMALREALQMAVNDRHMSVRASAKSEPGAMPAVIPVMGGNSSLVIGDIFRRAFSILPGGQLASDAPLFDDFSGMSLATYTPTSVDQANFDLDWQRTPDGLNWTTVRQLQERIRVQNIAVTSDVDGVVTHLTLDRNAQFTSETYNPDGSVNERTTLRPTTGLGVTIDYAMVASSGYVVTQNTISYIYGVPTPTTHGILTTMAGTQTITLTIPTEGMGVSFEQQEGTQSAATGTVLLTGLTGTIVQKRGVVFGMSATQIDATGPHPFPLAAGGYAIEKYYLPETVVNNVTFPTSVLHLAASGSAPAQGFVLDKLALNFPNIARTSGADAFNYKFSGGTAEVLLRYIGGNPADYGYIYRLAVLVTGINFDEALPNPLTDGADIAVTRVSTDNSVSGFHYRMVNQKPQLQPQTSVPFHGGTEAIDHVAVGTTGDLALHVTGTVRLADPALQQSTFTYDVTRAPLGDIAGRCQWTFAGADRTIFFTLANGTIVGRGYADFRATDDNVNTAASFTIPLTSRWIYNPSPPFGGYWSVPTIDYLQPSGNPGRETFTFDL